MDFLSKNDTILVNIETKEGEFMFSNWTFAKKLLLSVLSVVLLSSVISIFLIPSNTYNSSENLLKNT
ncbi:hypothetical protein CPG38_03075 [Malaciobacter marinus]|uniref:hypothetical protein n=1 Tax=Malaciobacter marinus TaxID=505249 RepID=UPI000C07270F|nr:hypothetical protein [Malaciobacter marinus]PHO13453.1 hypothetical protein CPG38_03075 [Malaciobacter marinus]